MRQSTPIRRAERLPALPQSCTVRFLCLVIVLINILLASTKAQEAAHPATSQSGTSTGGAHAPVKDALQRPITAGGFVGGAPVVYGCVEATLRGRGLPPAAGPAGTVPGDGVVR